MESTIVRRRGEGEGLVQGRQWGPSNGSLQGEECARDHRRGQLRRPSLRH
jgi:hypothetical protein